MAKAEFIKDCDRNMVVAVPLLLRIKNKKFILEGYALNNGLCSALSFAFMTFKDIAISFVLNNNNLSDEGFSYLLRGISTLKTVNSLKIEKNSFGPQSLQSLKIILNRKVSSYSIKKLHFKDCKLTPQITQELLTHLSSRKNFIESLHLINCNINSCNYKDLGDVITRSKYLRDLDISWNSMKQQELYELIDVIIENKTIHSLNLSHNIISNPNEHLFSM